MPTPILPAVLLALAAVQEPAAPPQEFDFRPGGPSPDAELGQYRVELSCAVADGPSGVLVLELWPEKAPRTVRNFLCYCAEGFYDGLGFHRILREFMVQGGDPSGNGTGKGPNGPIPDENSEDPRWAHGYGVISMAKSGPNTASCQFFICTADSASTFKLDGKFASFGKLASGVAMLESIANVEVARGPTNEVSQPRRKVTIVEARVKRGELPAREPIVRPEPDCGGEPLKVVVQHVLISFDGAPRSRSKRTKEEADAVARDVLERAKGGEDFSELVRSRSDDAIEPGIELPGAVRLLNHGAFDVPSQRALVELDREFEARRKLVEERFAKNEIDGASMGEEIEQMRQEMVRRAEVYRYLPRAGVVGGLGDAAFALAPGEVALVPWEAKRSPHGWHVLKRIE